MSTQLSPLPAARPVARLTWVIVAGLLMLYFAMAVSASWQKSPAFDELAHLTAGYNVWLNHDFRFDPANGDFVKRWAALPLVFSRPAFPPINDPQWRAGEFFAVGFKFFYKSGNDPASLLAQGRAMVALLGVALGLLVFICARELFGDQGGLLALGLFVFCPHMLAHGALITPDLALALTLFASTWCVWRLLHEITLGRLLASLVVLGLLLLSKISAMLIVPITAVMLAVRLVRGGPLVWRLGRERLLNGRRSQAVVWTGLVVMHVIFGWAAVWAGYSFKYPARADPADQGLVFRPADSGSLSGPMATAIGLCRRWHFLPEGYLNGSARYQNLNKARSAFMDGQWKNGGWHTFFPYAFWIKTPPALLLLLPFGLAGWWWCRHRPPAENAVAAQAPPLYAATPFLALLAVYGAAAVAQNLNIGHRHILPLYPALYVLAGSAALGWSARAVWARVAVGLLALWFAFDSLSIRPHYLAYFNAFAGGPAQGYRHLVDSSLDWGMDLPGLKHWLDIHNPKNRDPVFFAYFGTGSPEYYGIRSRRLPGFSDWYDHAVYPLEPGFYAISATLFESVYTRTFGSWNRVYETEYQEALANQQAFGHAAGDPRQRALLLEKHPGKTWEEQWDAFDQLRFGRLCAWLRVRRPPDDNIGYSILLWKLDQADLQAALFGPPSELEDMSANAMAHYDLGSALFQAGRMAQAKGQYREALRIKPDFAEAHYNLGTVLDRMGEMTGAMDSYGEALRFKPDYAEAHYNLGTLLARQGRVPEAIRHYGEALRLRPDYAEAHNNLGTLLAQTGRMAEAIGHYQEALRLKPGYADARDNLARLRALRQPPSSSK